MCQNEKENRQVMKKFLRLMKKKKKQFTYQQ